MAGKPSHPCWCAVGRDLCSSAASPDCFCRGNPAQPAPGAPDLQDIVWKSNTHLIGVEACEIICLLWIWPHFIFFFKHQGWCITTPRCLLLTAPQINLFGWAKMSTVWIQQYLVSEVFFSGEKLVKDEEHVSHVPACRMHSHLPHLSLLEIAWQENPCRFFLIYIFTTSNLLALICNSTV